MLVVTAFVVVFIANAIGIARRSKRLERAMKCQLDVEKHIRMARASMQPWNSLERPLTHEFTLLTSLAHRVSAVARSPARAQAS